MPEEINFKVDIPGRDVHRLGPRAPSMKHVIAAIRSYQLHPGLEEELIRRASSYPTVALPKFISELTKHISEAQYAISQQE